MWPKIASKVTCINSWKVLIPHSCHHNNPYVWPKWLHLGKQGFMSIKVGFTHARGKHNAWHAPLFCIQAWTRMSIYCYNMRFIKHFTKFPNVFGRHLYLSMNLPPTKEEGSYAYSLRVRGRLHLIIGVRSFPLLSRHKNHPLLMPCDLHMFRCMIIFALCITMAKVHRSGTFQKCDTRLGWHLILGPLPKGPPTLGLYPTHKYVQYLKAKFMRGLIHGEEEKIMELRYCAAMDHMHRNGIFHRDIKPENILIMEEVLKVKCTLIYSHIDSELTSWSYPW